MATTFRNATATVSVALETETCCRCGVVFAMAVEFRKQRIYDKQTFYCPDGHPQNYVGKTDAQKLAEAEDKLRQATERIAAEQGWTRRLTDDLATERRSHASTKGQLTKTRNRIEKGVCPDCNRHFANVERHMASQHGAPA